MPKPLLHSFIATFTVLASVRNAAAESCEEVWFVEGSFVGETFTCGERIVYLQTPQGGGKTEQEARVQASLEELKCADCWPWEKYREDGETERSPKRGIAIENRLLTSEALSGLSQIVSWGVTWDYQLQGGPDLSVWKMAGIDFVPLIWGAGTIPQAQADGLPEGSKALLGFNEPNFPNQANLDPHTAALHWKDVEKLAEDNNISTIVSPSMNYHESMDPIEWLEQFLGHCNGCKVDAIGIHVFACYAAGLKYHLDRYRALGKPMWITEIACSDWQSPERLSAEGQMAYMREAIPLLEADEDVQRYAWFSYFKDEWAHPIVDGENGDAGLVHPNGTLTPLGQLYNTFAAGTNLTEINITEPQNETGSTTAMNHWSHTLTTSATTSKTDTTTVSLTESTTGSSSSTSTATSSISMTTSSLSATSTGSSSFTETSLTSTSTQTTSVTATTASASRTSTATRSSAKEATTTASATSTTESWTRSATASLASSTSSSSSRIPSTSMSVTSTTPSETVENVEISSTTAGVPTTTRSTTFSTNFETETATSSTTPGTSVSTPSTSSTPEASTTQRSSLTSTTGGGEFTTTEAEYDDDEENATNETDNDFVVHSCTEAVDAWCQSDPSSAPFLPLQHCADWRLRDAMCSSPGNANKAPQFAGTTELEQGSFPALFLLLAVLGAAMAGAALASLFNRQKCAYLCCCCGRHRAENQDEEELKHAISEKPDWQGNFLPVLCNKNNAIARVAPEPGLLLPMEAVARRVASSPHASEGICEGSPVIGALSRKTMGNEVAIGTPVGTTPASRAAALTTLTEAMAKATSADVSLDEREIALHQAGRVLCSKAALTLPLALRQEAETWHSRQEERLNLAKSMEAVVERAANLEEAAGWEVDADRLGALLSRAMVADKVELEALLRESARRASAFEDELENQRLLLHREPRPAKQSLLTAADLMEQTSNLTEMQTKAVRELTELQALQDPDAGEEWKTACDSLESKWKQFVADSGEAVEEAQAALAANRTAKILTSDAEREAALAEASRRQATFQEELQKQRQKLQKRSKAKSAAPTPLELGRLLEDEGALQALKQDREEAMKECQQFVDAAASTSGEWRDLLEGWQMFEEDLANLSSHNQDLREKMPEGSIWASAGTLARLRKTDVSHGEQLAMLAEAARCAAAFDEELQKQRQQMKKRRKALQKHGGAEQAQDSLEVCRTLADEEILKGLSEKQAEAHAKCQAMAIAGEGMSEAWEQLAATWVQMEKDMNKAEKEVSEASKVVTSDANSGLVQALGLAQDSEAAREVDDDTASHRKALKEAARHVAVFDEELSKQRAAVMRRRAANPSGALVLGHVLLDGEVLKALAAECAKAEAACQAAAEEATAKNDGEAEQWKDLLKLWGMLQKELTEDIEQAEAEAKACRAQEASEALAAAGLPAAVRRALKFEKELADLSREGHQGMEARSELQRAKRLASVTTLRAEHAKGLELCQAGVAAAGNGNTLPHMVECRNAWEELVELWQGLGKDLEVAAQELATERPEHTFWRKVFDTSVSEAERQTILAEAARCAAQFDQEFQQQRQRLVRRKKVAVENVGDRLLVLGNAVDLQVLAKETEAAKSACERALNEAKATDNVEEAQGWEKVLDLYAALGTDMEAARKEVDANGSFSGEPDVDVGRHMVRKVIRDQKKSAASCLTAVELALNADRGPLEELMEAQQAPCSLKSGGASTNRSRNAQVSARVQMWDVLEEAQGLLDSFKDKSSEKTKSPTSLKRLGDEASKQLQEISDTYSPPKLEDKPAMKDFGCQTVFRLGGMAWHPNPAIQHLLEELTKVSSQGDVASDTSLLSKLDAEVTDIINRWKNEFIGKRREASRTRSRSRSQSRSAEAAPASLPAAVLQPKDSPQSIEMKVEAEAAPLSKCDEVQDIIAKTSPSSQLEDKQTICGPEAPNQGDAATPRQECKEKVINLKVHEEESNVVRRNPPTGRRVSSPGRLPSSRLAHAESRSLLPGSANSDAEVTVEDKPASRPRRRRSLSRDRDLSGAATEALPPRPPPCEPAKKEELRQELQQPEALHNDLLAQLEMKLSGSQPLDTFSELHDSKNAGHPVAPSGRRGGPGDGSLLVPPPSGDVSRSLSPASSLGSSQSPGHMPRRLDPIVRPHAPPLPSAGRLLLATQESPADSARSSPRSGF